MFDFNKTYKGINCCFFMIIKNKVFVILFLLLFLLAGCGEVSEGYSLYEDKSKDYSLERPASWQQTSLQNNDIAFINSDKTMLLAVKSFELQTDFSNYVTNMKDNIPKVLSGGVLLGEEKMNVAGNNAQKLVFSYGTGAGNFKYGAILIEDKTKNRVVILTFTTVFEKYDYNYEILQHALNTLDLDV